MKGNDRRPIRASRLPVVRQMSDTECGAACLAMVLQHFGRDVSLFEVRDALGAGRDGTSAATLLAVAGRFGLRGRGVSLEVGALHRLPRGAVLHWGFKHFVVLERMRGEVAEVVDPALGRRRVDAEELRREFTGIAVLLEPGEGFERRAPVRWRTWRQLQGVALASGHVVQVVVLSAVLQVVAMGLPFVTGALVDKVVPRQDFSLLIALGVGAAGLVLYYLLTSLIRYQLLLHLRTRLEAEMTLGFVKRLITLPFSFFQRRSAGDLLARVNSHAVIREIFTYGTITSMIDGVLLVVFVALLGWANARLAALVMVVAALQVLVFLVTRRRLSELAAEGLRHQSTADSHLVEMLGGMETLKVMGSEDRAFENWQKLFAGVLNSAFRRSRLRAISDCLFSALYMACPFAVLAYGALLVLRSEMTLGAMLSLNALAGGLLGPLSRLLSAASQFQLLGSYMERIDDVMRTAPEREAGQGRPAPRLAGRVELDRVSFRYAPFSPDVLQDISLVVEPGECVAIVGCSGSGKSSLANLIVGLHPAGAGRVLHDGHDVAGLELQSLRRQLGFVPQRPYIFGTTIRENIALGSPGLPLDEIEAAARLACVHDEIAAMPLGYDTPLSDAGSSISGGQRQRLALARALARAPRVLVLDEATSALDAVRESQVLASLSSLSCTRIIIAHRLSTVRNADRIVVLDAGRIVESGSHHQLMARAGAYAALVAAQLGGQPAAGEQPEPIPLIQREAS